jgi:hypothetical protein
MRKNFQCRDLKSKLLDPKSGCTTNSAKMPRQQLKYNISTGLLPSPACASGVKPKVCAWTTLGVDYILKHGPVLKPV